MSRKERHKQRKARPPAAEDQSFWARRGWPSTAPNGKDKLEQTPVEDWKVKATPVEEEENPTFSEALKGMVRTDPTHDEFSVKSIVISAVLASSILAGAFYLAKMIVDIMARE